MHHWFNKEGRTHRDVSRRSNQDESFSFRYLGSSEPGPLRCQTPAREGWGLLLCSSWTPPPKPLSSSAHSAQWWLEKHTSVSQKSGMVRQSAHRGIWLQFHNSLSRQPRFRPFLGIRFVHGPVSAWERARRGDGSSALWEATDIMDVMTQHQDSSEPHNSHRDGWRHGARCPNSVFVPSSLQMAILHWLGRSFTCLWRRGLMESACGFITQRCLPHRVGRFFQTGR